MASIASVHAGGGHARAIVALVGLLIFINYVDRGNLATAGPLIKGELGLSNTEFGLLVSAFFWSYVPGQLVAGWLAQRFDAYRVLAAGLVVWALATAATALATGFATLLALRLLLGLGESVAFPASSKLFADHLPPERYGQGNGATAIGLSFGPAFGIYAGGLLMAAAGWRASFVLFGALSLVWLVPWLSLDRAAPRVHAADGPGQPLAAIVARPQAWAAALAHFCTNYGFYFMLSWLPLYLVKTQGFTLAGMASLGGVIYLIQGGTAMIAGPLTDRWVLGGWTANRARKIMLVAGTGLQALCMAAVVLGDAQVVIGALLIAGIANGISSSCIFATGQTIAGPKASGTWIGFQNCMGNCSGIVGPIVTGWLVDHGGGYPAAFAVAGGIAVLGMLACGVLIGRIEPIDWVGPNAARNAAAPVVTRA